MLAQEGDLGGFTHTYTDSFGAGRLNDWAETQRTLIWSGREIDPILFTSPFCRGNLQYERVY